MNWWQNAIYKWIDYIKKYIDLRVSTVADNFSHNYDVGVDGLDITISSGSIQCGSSIQAITGATVSCPANSTTYIWVDTESNAIDSGAALPAASLQHSWYLLYTVTSGASTLTTIADKRFSTMLRKASASDVTTGTDNEKYITPLRLAGALASIVNATTSLYGKARLADNTDLLLANRSGNTDVLTADSLTYSNFAASETSPGIVELATNAEVQTGTDSVRSITPAGLTARSATESRTGILELATTAETVASTDDERAVTPLKLLQRFTSTGLQSLASEGYQKLPGGLIIQWGTGTSSGTSRPNFTKTFPVSFPTACLSVQVIPVDAVQSYQAMLHASPTTTAFNGCITTDTYVSSGIAFMWFAIGY
jgi:hypothetical protein